MHVWLPYKLNMTVVSLCENTIYFAVRKRTQNHVLKENLINVIKQ